MSAANDARLLDVFLNGDRVGQLREQRDVWAFQYDPAWLAPPRMPLCNKLPLQPDWQIDTPTQRPAFWFFENLLPEEQALAAVAADAGLKPEQAFELLTVLGAESAGALTLLPPGKSSPPAKMRALTDESLRQRLRDLPAGSLVAGAPKRMSLAGAQHKLAVIYDSATDHLYEPVGAQASTHILKPQHPHPQYCYSVYNEYFCMRLAKDTGLNVPRVWLHFTGAQPDAHAVYLIERFDRREEHGEVRRLYALDACQLLGEPRRNKYDAATLANLRTCIDQTAAPAQSRQAVLSWLAFNWLIGNGDAHLKNLSFLREGNAPWLAPAYDLLSTAVYALDEGIDSGRPDGLDTATMVIPLAGEARFTAIRRAHLRDTAAALGAAPRAMDPVLDTLLARIEPAADALLAELTAGGRAPAGALRLLRQIRHAVIGRLRRNP